MDNNFYVVGKNSVLDAIENNYPIIEIYIDSASKKIANYGKCKVVGKEFFNAFSNLNHQGYVAKIKPPSIYEIDVIKKEKPEQILVLDHIQDVGNFGAILRSANAFKFDYVIFPKDRCAKLTPQVLKISSGGFVNTKFIQVANISAALNYLKEQGYWIYVSALEKKSVSIKKTDFTKPLVLVIGNEAKGCSLPVINQADVLVHIDMFGSVQSLNASVAAGVLMYEVTRRSNN
ncbi:rRNA methylase [Mycoplasmopsis californica]|uniref:23S rRNA (Guanosine(2251)-2'-O)-methyltransferase RlmB n=1 Tax=Mycoplasmopsis equigenitalium TaxID=114883 RepID=A0ABY5J4K7_9BACT|nr:23S rRNA (guanosine(2251)-2'-O)-methyltransferase RlmB [Mycoplasmopsis equigenitalium]UUD36816.1 23S rRNA (guanosine(2251)-2'-O)-methyltransferase RlmB [Mycoplasmopsis equigenitalium]VEU69887.1 rRNA methylase [Mycoplasmopsis californica]